jgi:hypothetical protein
MNGKQLRHGNTSNNLTTSKYFPLSPYYHLSVEIQLYYYKDVIGGVWGTGSSSMIRQNLKSLLPPLGEKMGKNFSSCPDCHTPIGHLIFIFF